MPEHHPDDDVIAELMVDHREVEELFAKIEGEQSAEDRQDTFEQIITELVRHSIAEESWLYPAVEDKLPGGKEIADKERADHQQVEELLKELEGEDPHAPESRPKVTALITSLRAHIQDEENNLFPALRAHASAEELRELGDKVRTTKKAAPTRPHPSAPRGELARKTLGPVVGLVDRTRDLLTGRNR